MAAPADEVLDANSAFYAAFARRDVGAMEALWARSVPVACIHPGWHALRGRDDVMASWRTILGSAGSPAIACANATAHVLGDAAFVICEERIEAARLVATNVFIREQGRWRLAHHQAAPFARPSEPEEDETPAGGGALN